MEQELIQFHASLQRAVDIALWMNFKYRMDKRSFGVIQDKKSNRYQVVETKGRKKANHILLPSSYAEMTYEDIQEIRSEVNPLSHWEEIAGRFATYDGELLRFILTNKIPLEKFIRHELASRGYDENQLWVGYKKASLIWLR